MDINAFIESFAAQFDETDAKEFKPETEFRKLDEWSSLMALTIIAMADEDFGVTLSGDDIRGAKTIGDLFDAVELKKDAKN